MGAGRPSPVGRNRSQRAGTPLREGGAMLGGLGPMGLCVNLSRPMEAGRERYAGLSRI